jgi:putative CocE/NonD family hydrolase
MGGGTGDRDAQGRRRHGGAWREDTSWPPSFSVPQSFYLSPTGSLDTQPTEDGTILLQSDPANPVPTIGGALTSGAPVMEGGAYDQVTGPGTFGARAPFLPLAARRDVLVFTTPPLARDVEIAGPVEVHLTLSTDAPDADITVKLIDWAPRNADYPQGFAMNLSDGILRLRYRDDWANPRPMTLGERVSVTIPAPPTAALFRAGHRIRLDISGSNFPRFDVNPQTGEPEGQARAQRIASTTLHLGATRARLVLCVVQK